ncbi:MAG: hypothetical protein EPN43_05180 [Jatrophihabitans sp.]|nr:MAG: hypothetical protein EPN43_05180 [Jatrophihabitans sp.]
MDEARRLAQLDFDDLTAPYLGRSGADRAAMFGGSGLRLNGKFVGFVASGGRLVLKLPAERAAAVIAGGGGEPVTVGGRATREWVGVPHAAVASWPALIGEAFDYMSALTRSGSGPAGPNSTTASSKPASA